MTPYARKWQQNNLIYKRDLAPRNPIYNSRHRHGTIAPNITWATTLDIPNKALHADRSTQKDLSLGFRLGIWIFPVFLYLFLFIYYWDLYIRFVTVYFEIKHLACYEWIFFESGNLVYAIRYLLFYGMYYILLFCQIDFYAEE